MERTGRVKKKKVKRKIIVYEDIIKELLTIICDLTETEEEKHFYSSTYHFNQTDEITRNIKIFICNISKISDL